jgi:lipopolysaccharide export system permease protein
VLFDINEPTVMVKRIDAEKMIMENGKWVLVNAVERDFAGGGEILKTCQKIPADEIEGIRKLNLTTASITKKFLKPDEMTYTELSEFIETQLKGGQDVDRTRVDFYSKISFPFSSLIVIIFGISISTGSRKRKGLALQFGISILVSFIYLGFVKISQTFGYNGDLNPVLTAWLANIAFALFGGINLYLRNY